MTDLILTIVTGIIALAGTTYLCILDSTNL